MATDMDDDESPKSGSRINVSVAVLEERLQRWAETVQRGMDNMMAELRRRDERYDNQIGDLVIWKTQHEIQFEALTDKITEIRGELDNKIKPDIEMIKKKKSDEGVAFNAKINLLKTQWAWIMAGAFAMSLIIGMLVQLGLISVGG